MDTHITHMPPHFGGSLVEIYASFVENIGLDCAIVAEFQSEQVVSFLRRD